MVTRPYTDWTYANNVYEERRIFWTLVMCLLKVFSLTLWCQRTICVRCGHSNVGTSGESTRSPARGLFHSVRSMWCSGLGLMGKRDVCVVCLEPRGRGRTGAVLVRWLSIGQSETEILYRRFIGGPTPSSASQSPSSNMLVHVHSTVYTRHPEHSPARLKFNIQRFYLYFLSGCRLKYRRLKYHLLQRTLHLWKYTQIYNRELYLGIDIFIFWLWWFDLRSVGWFDISLAWYQAMNGSRTSKE